MLASVIIVVTFLAILVVHLTLATRIWRSVSFPTSLLVLLGLSLMTEAAIFVAAFPIGLYVGMSSPYSGSTLERQVAGMTFGILLTGYDLFGYLFPQSKNITAEESLLYNLLFGVGVLFVLGLIPALFVRHPRKARTQA